MISFRIEEKSSVSPREICEGIFDVSKWNSFEGYGPLPGIRNVSMESPRESEVGTVFHVENTDGSRHRETIESYEPERSVVIRMDAFTPPLSKLASHFIERWSFDGTDPDFRVIRTFDLYPKSALSAVPLWIISRLLKRAVVRHTLKITAPSKT